MLLFSLKNFANVLFLVVLFVAATLPQEVIAETDLLHCDYSDSIIASRAGQSGRRYECYTLKEFPVLRIGSEEIYCDEPGPTTTTQRGLSGRRYECYSIREVAVIHIRGVRIQCDLAGTRTGASIGRSSYRYPCYPLSAVRAKPVGR